MGLTDGETGSAIVKKTVDDRKLTEGSGPGGFGGRGGYEEFLCDSGFDV